jgi:hypothetical protein
MIDYDRYSRKHRKQFSLPWEKENINALSIPFIRQGAHSHLTFIALSNTISRGISPLKHLEYYCTRTYGASFKINMKKH